jgi:Helix-turn-helix domain
MSQRNAILAYLMHGGHPLDAPMALRRFHCYRLAARIFELRRRGHLIRTSRNGAFTVYWYGGRKTRAS